MRVVSCTVCPMRGNSRFARSTVRSRRHRTRLRITVFSLALLGALIASALTSTATGAEESWAEVTAGTLPGSPSTEDLSGASFGDGTLWSVDNELNHVVRWVETAGGWQFDNVWDISEVDSMTPTNDPEAIAWISPGHVVVVDEATNRLLFLTISGADVSLDRAVDLSPWVGPPVGGDGLEGIAYSRDESTAAVDVFYVGLENSADLFRAAVPSDPLASPSVAQQALDIPEVAGLAINETSGEILIVSEEDKTIYAMSSWGATPTALFSVPDMEQPEGIAIDADGTRIVIIGEGSQEYSVWVPTVSCGPGGFSDVDMSSYYADAVQWASCAGITTGTSDGVFSPSGPVSRAQMATFLWRYAGEPAGSPPHGFLDVPADSFFDEAVAWLSDQEITTGTSDTTFSPGETVTRAQMATFLWRYADEPAAVPHGFADVPAGSYFDDAVSWMSAAGITTGTSNTTYSPARVLNRAQAVTMLWRFAGEPGPPGPGV